MVLKFLFGEKAPGINVEFIQKYVANDLQSIGETTWYPGALED